VSSTTRKRCRSGHPCQPLDLKEALDCLGHHSDRPLREIAERVGRTESTLGKECSRYDEDHYPPLRMVVPLTLASENDALVTYLARAVGGVFVRIESSIGRGVDQEHAARAVATFGQLLHQFGEALADGTITDQEADAIQYAGDDTITAIAALSAYTRHRVRLAVTGRTP
jgi:hypothetical protein